MIISHNIRLAYVRIFGCCMGRFKCYADRRALGFATECNIGIKIRTPLFALGAQFPRNQCRMCDLQHVLSPLGHLVVRFRVSRRSIEMSSVLSGQCYRDQTPEKRKESKYLRDDDYGIYLHVITRCHIPQNASITRRKHPYPPRFRNSQNSRPH